MESSQPNWDFAVKPRWLDAIISMSYLVGVAEFLFLGMCVFPNTPGLISLILIVIPIATLYLANTIEDGSMPRIEFLGVLLIVLGTLCALLTISMFYTAITTRSQYSHLILVVASIFTLPSTVLLVTGALALSIRRKYAVWSAHQRSHRDLDRWCHQTVAKELTDRGISLTPHERLEFECHRIDRTRLCHGIFCRILTWIELARPNSYGVRTAWSLPSIIGDRVIPDFSVSRLENCFVFGFAGDDPIAIDAETGYVFQFVTATSEMIKRADSFSQWWNNT